MILGFARNRQSEIGNLQRSFRSGFTLLEILLVTGLLAVLSVLALPAMLREISEERLPASARDLRSLVSLVRSRAMIEGKRYRLRFPGESEIDASDESRQPIVERENNPLEEPGTYEPVLAAWATEATLQRGIRCLEVRMGKPTLDEEEVARMQEEFRLEMESLTKDFDAEFPPVYFELDGTSEWAVFVLTESKEDAESVEDLPVWEVIEVILDGMTGLIWLQRPFLDEEKEMLKENDWPPVLRQDFLNPRPLTEDDVLEIQESKVRQ